MNSDKHPGGEERTSVPSGVGTQTIAEERPPVGSASGADHHGDRLILGTRLGEFEITALVGEGGFSIVYLAWDHSLERRVALKEYFPSSLAMRTAGAQVSARSARHRETFEVGLRSFVNEGKLLAQFDHPALVKVYRFWEAHGTAYMVMPFYEGTTLRETVRAMSEPPDEAWLMALLGPLTEALMVIHKVQCFHRDVAPDNVLLLPSTRPLLLDFGAARRVIGDRTQALTVILKPGYAPIEQYAEDVAMRQGPWTDVYALAAVVYWTITGKTPPVAVGRMLNDAFVPLAKCAAGRYGMGFLQAVDRALAVLPEHRTQSIEQFRRELGLDRDDRDAPQQTVAWVDPEKTVLRPAAAGFVTPLPPPPNPARAASARAIEADGMKTGLSGPLARPATRQAPAIAAALAALITSGVAVWWWSSQPPRAVVATPDPPASAAPTVAAPGPTESFGVPSGPATTSPASPAGIEPPPVAARTFTASAAIEQLYAERDPSIEITASATPTSSGAMLRIQFKGKEAGHAYVIALPRAADRLQLLYPPSLGTVRKLGDAGHVDVPAASLEAGARLAMVLSRERRQIVAAGWAPRNGLPTRTFDAPLRSASIADAVLGTVVCGSSTARCDPAFGMTEVTSMTNVTTRPPTPPERVDERSEGTATRPPAARTSPANRSADVLSTEEKSTARRDNGQAAECARILQRLSLGESNAELIERMKTLRCS